MTSTSRLLPWSTENYLNSLLVLQPMPEMLENQNSILLQALEDIDAPMTCANTL